MVDGFLAALAEIGSRADSIMIIDGPQLEQRLGRDQVDAVIACGANLRCVAGIGDKAGATHVLFGRATAQPDGVSMQWLLVKVSTAGIVGKFLAKLTDAAAVRGTAAQMARELLGITAAEMPGPPAGAVAPAPVSGGVDPPPLRTDRESFWSSPSVVGGTAAIACGVLFVGAGVYFGLRARSAVPDVVHGPGGSTLAASLISVDPGRADTKRATVLLSAGGLIVAGGAALWASEFLAVAPVISVDANARIVGFSVTW